MLHVLSNTMWQRKCAVSEITRRQRSSGYAFRHAGAAGTGDNNGTAVCRLLNVPTHHCAECRRELRKAEQFDGRPHIVWAWVEVYCYNFALRVVSTIPLSTQRKRRVPQAFLRSTKRREKTPIVQELAAATGPD